jgi:hypothetical protein
MHTEVERVHDDLIFKDRVTRRDIDTAIKNYCLEVGVTKLGAIRSASALFDFSRCWWIDLDAAHWLLNIVRVFRQSDNALRIRLPDVETADQSNVWSFLIRWRFFAALTKVAGPATDFLSEDQAARIFDTPKYREGVRMDPYGRRLPLLTDRLLAVAGAFVDRTLPLQPQLDAFVHPFRDIMLLQALSQWCGISHDDAGSLISFMAEEGSTNSILHAEGDYTLSSMQIVDAELADMLNSEPHLEIVISDNGIGIPEVLRRAEQAGTISARELPEDHGELIELFASKDLSVDSAIIAAATQPGVSSEPGRRGFGLHHFIRYAGELNANVLIRSGHAAVLFEGGSVTRQYNRFAESLGTLITVSIPTT